MLFETLSPNIPVFATLPWNPRGAGEVLVVYRVSPRSDKVGGRPTRERMVRWQV